MVEIRERLREITNDQQPFVCFTGASVFVHNCSSDPLTCERYGITGYPTLTAFRSLSWSAVARCSSSHSTYLRLDYHGPVVVSNHRSLAE